MNSRILREFLKDQLEFTLAIYGSSAFVILFYWLQGDQKIEVVYPLLLVTFVYFIFMIKRFFRYYSFDRTVEAINGRFEADSFFDKKITRQQNRFIAKLNEVQSESLKKINALELQMANKNKVISQMIHNIKTPTSVIDLIVQNSKMEKNPSEDVIGEIDQENRLINANLDQLLSYLRLDYFQNDFLIEEVDVVGQLRDIINSKKNQFIHHHIFPQLLVGAESILVLTDNKWNKFLLEQLISNAIKYTAIKETDKNILIRIEREGERVHLLIEDKGMGIPENDLKRVFEPFFTGENGRKVRNATGIGLHICKNIATSLNHPISLTSKVDEGTKVKVTYLSKL